MKPKQISIISLIVCLILSCDKPKYNLFIDIFPKSAGAVEINPPGVIHPEGTIVELAAIPSEGYSFIEWEGDINSENNPLEFVLSKDFSISCEFEEITYPLESCVKVFGGSQEEWSNQIIEVPNEGYIISGTTYSNDGDFLGLNNGSSDIFIIKVGLDGNLLWAKTYGGSEQDNNYSLIPAVDGGFVITGYTWSNDGDFEGLHFSYKDAFIIKLDKNGEKQWVKVFGGSWDDIGQAVVETTDGGYILTGYSEANNGDFLGMNRGGADIFAIKLDSNGDTEWIQTYGGTSDDEGKFILNNSNNGYLIIGETNSNDGAFRDLNKGNNDIFILALSSSGELISTNTYGGSNNDIARSSINSNENGVLITGYTWSNDGDFGAMNLIPDYAPYIFILKINSYGNVEWLTSAGGTSSDEGKCITQTNDDGYIITGRTGSNDGDFDGLAKGGSDIFVLKLNSSGDANWLKTYGGSDGDIAQCIIQTMDGKYSLAGSSYSNDGDFFEMINSHNDIFIMRLDLSGNLFPFKQ